MSQANKPQKFAPFGGAHIPQQQQQQQSFGHGNKKSSTQQNYNQQSINGTQIQQTQIQGNHFQRNDDLGLHRTQMKANTIENLSRVLLVIFNTTEMKTNQELFDMFSPFVRVLRVLIFERKEQNIKCFVEIMTQAEATYVKNQFQFQKSKNQQRNFQIYYSQIQTIDLQNHYSEGQDFSSFYATNPNFTCQYMQENANLFKNASQVNYGQHQKSMNNASAFKQSFMNTQKQPISGSLQNQLYFNNFDQSNTNQNNQSGYPQTFINPQQFIPNQIQNDIDPNFDPTSPFPEGGIRPNSISSIDYQLQSHFHLSQHHHQTGNVNESQNQFSQLNNGNIGNLTSRHTVHGNLTNTNNTPLESKIYVHIKPDGLQQQTSPQKSMSQHIQQQQMLRNQRADQFHKDFMIKDGILQNHINQQFQQSAQKSSLLSPYYNMNQTGLQNDISNNNHLISMNSSTNRSPSSTSYSLTNNNNQYDSDIDENVQASQPSTFHTKYRDGKFFNGNSNTGYNEEGENQQAYSSIIINPAQQQQQYQHEDGLQNQLANGELEAKRVLFVRHLDYPELKITMLYNLFSNYGNIVKIIFMKQKRQALIEFEETSQASSAKEFLNNLIFYNAQIKIDYSKYDQIDIQRKKLHSGESNDQEQVLSIPPQCYRYKNKKLIPQYGPKNTLHVSNIRKEYFDYNLLHEFFSSQGAKIINLKLIPNEKKQMCLIQFETLDDALKVISTLHDAPFHGRNLCISFTKSTNQVQQQAIQQPNNQSTKYQNNNNLDQQMLLQQQQLQKQMQNLKLNNNINKNLMISQQQYQQNQLDNFPINPLTYNNNYSITSPSPNIFNNFDINELNDSNYHQYFDTNDDSDDDVEVDNSIKYLGI